ncbi:MAG: chromosome segregation protein ScpA [Ruminococcaceae bacterium]|nr:chromosome segregation protein ScpA [Oscillospiraceae bacterium]
MNEPTYHLTGVVRSHDELPEDFDGPLDVILSLLSKNKIEIQDVSITSILEQYLAYLDEMKRLDMEIASEFIAMASYLMLIKTKMLLSAAEREEALSEMELLIRSLEERQRADAYEQIRKAIEFLEPRNEIGCNIFVKQPEPYQPDTTYRYQHEKEDLLRAFQAVQERSERRLPPPIASFQGIVGAEPYPVTKKAAQLLKKLLMRGVSKFRNLFKGSKTRSEIVATFLAVLELCKLRSIRIEDTETDDVDVCFCKMPDDEMEELDGASRTETNS